MPCRRSPGAPAEPLGRVPAPRTGCADVVHQPTVFDLEDAVGPLSDRTFVSDDQEGGAEFGVDPSEELITKLVLNALGPGTAKAVRLCE